MAGIPLIRSRFRARLTSFDVEVPSRSMSTGSPGRPPRPCEIDTVPGDSVSSTAINAVTSPAGLLMRTMSPGATPSAAVSAEWR